MGLKINSQLRIPFKQINIRGRQFVFSLATNLFRQKSFVYSVPKKGGEAKDFKPGLMLCSPPTAAQANSLGLPGGP